MDSQVCASRLGGLPSWALAQKGAMLFSKFILSVLTFLLSPPYHQVSLLLVQQDSLSGLLTPTPGGYCVFQGRVDSETCWISGWSYRSC